MSQLTTSGRSDRPTVAARRSGPRPDVVRLPPVAVERAAGDTPAADRPRDAGPTPSADRSRAAGVVLLGAMLTLGVLVVAALSGGSADPVLLADPGPVTRWGVLVSRTSYDLAAIGTLGVLLLAVVILPRSEGGFGPDAARLIRRVSWWAAVWAVSALVTVVLTLSKIAGLPALSVLAPDVLPLAMDLESTRALLSSAWLAVLVAIGARMTRSPATGLLLLLTATGAILLPALSGHVRHGELATLTAVSLALHVAAAALWVGGLGALIVHLRRSAGTLAVALPRYSNVALMCFVAVGASGLVTGWASLGTLDQLWTTPYGRLLLAKVAALALLGGFGHRHRARTVAAVAQQRPRAFVRLACAELILMACAAALAVVLSSTAPPPELEHGASASSDAVVAGTAR